MTTGRMAKADSLPEERLVVSLVNLPRTKVEFIEFTPSEASRETDRHFLLRKIKFFAADNIKGYEIKLTPEAVKMLYEAIGQLTTL